MTFKGPFAAVLLLWAGTACRLLGEVVYTNDFQGIVGPEWSVRTKSTTPAGGRQFLGQFASTLVSLTLTNLPPHGYLTLEYDLYLIQSWDGNDREGCGPDLLRVWMPLGKELMAATFSTHDLTNASVRTQSFPGHFPADQFHFGTGAAETNVLGYGNWALRRGLTTGGYLETNAFGYHFRTTNGVVKSLLEDTVYRLRHVVTHDTDSFRVNFAMQSPENSVGDESWGLDNVVVTVSPTVTVEPPNISRHPLSSTNILGEAGATLSVIADGFRPFAYQWLREGSVISGATNATLNLEQLAWNYQGAYQAVISNPGGSVTSQVARITLVAPDRSYLTNGLAAYYPLSGDARDESGNARDGTVVSATLAEDRFGRPDHCYSFDARSNSYISLNTDDVPPDVQLGTISWWQKVEDLEHFRLPNGTLSQTKFIPLSGFANDANRWDYYLCYGGNYAFCGQFEWFDDQGYVGRYANSVDFLGGSLAQFTAWTHFVFTFSSDGAASFYCNGVSIPINGEWRDGAPNFKTPLRNLKLGTTTFPGGSVGESYAGELDDVRIYSRALAPGEVSNLYAYEKPGGADTDADGLSDYDELMVHHTDWLTQDTDRDGASDGDELAEGTNPLDPGSGPPPRLATPSQLVGKVGTLLSQDLTVRYPVTGFGFPSLPANLTGDTNTGRITGVPASAGTYLVPVILANPWGARTNALTLSIAKGTPAVVWAPPASIPYGTILDLAFFNPVASVPGAFSLTPALGTKPDTGLPVTASVTFTPEDVVNYESVTITRETTVTKANQTITFDLPATTVLGEPPPLLNGDSTSGLPLAFDVVSGPGEIVGARLSILGGGTVTVRASQPGNSQYHPAPSVLRSVEVRLRLTVPAVPGGVILREPESETLGYGGVAVLTAIPDDNYLFEGWAGNYLSRQNPLTMTLTNNTTIIPLFTPRWTLTVANTIGGTVTTEPPATAVTNGCHVVATAIPAEGYGFRGWRGTITSSSNPVEFALHTNINLNAEFQRLVQLSIVQTEGGTIAVNPSQPAYFAGDTVSLIATPNEGFRFHHWQPPLEGQTNGGILLLTSNIVIEGAFARLQRIALQQTGEGVVTVQGGIYHEVGDTVTVTAEPMPGWAFAGWSGSVTNDNGTLTFIVSTNTMLSATFKRWFAVSLSATGAGSVEMLPPGGRYLDGTILELRAKPDRYWRFKSWKGGADGTDNPVTLIVTSDLSVVADFVPGYRVLIPGQQDLSSGFGLRVEGEKGAVYIIETSSGLISWTPLTTITNTGEATDYLDKQARSISRRFYRVRPGAP